MANFEHYMRARREQVDAWLDGYLPAEDAPPVEIHRAMRYSIFAGGKRLRPLLALAAGEVFNAPEHWLRPVCCALEMIHTYSLIHDDLPAMDNDDVRRGQPTCHKVFGEAIAILAGDALLTRAFQTLAQPSIDPLFLQRQSQLIAEIAMAAGTEQGMIAGQVMDMLAEGSPIDATTLEHLHRAKTGALIRASVRAGGLLGDADQTELQRLTAYAEAIGLAFQIVDDILDLTATRSQLGKTPGKDAKAGKATYPAFYGLERSCQIAYQLVERAVAEIGHLRRDATRLEQLARYIIERIS